MTDRTFPRVHVFGPLRVFDEHGTEHVPTREAERTLLLFLALHGRCVHVEQAMEALWPGIAPSEGRMLLRKLLYRLRTLYGPLVVREGDTLVLRADTDLADYEAALATLATYRNLQLAPDARYADWAQVVRHSLDPGHGNSQTVELALCCRTHVVG